MKCFPMCDTALLSWEVFQPSPTCSSDTGTFIGQIKRSMEEWWGDADGGNPKYSEHL